MVAMRLDNLFRVDVASTPSSPSTEATKGEKYRRCWRQAYRYIHFFPLYASCRHLSGSFVLCVRGVGVHDLHVVDTVCTLLPEVTYQQVALLFRDLRRRHYCMVFISVCPGWCSLHPLHGAT